MSLSFAPMVTQISSDKMILRTKYQNEGQPAPNFVPRTSPLRAPSCSSKQEDEGPWEQGWPAVGPHNVPMAIPAKQKWAPRHSETHHSAKQWKYKGRVGKQKPCMASKWPVHYLQWMLPWEWVYNKSMGLRPNTADCSVMLHWFSLPWSLMITAIFEGTPIECTHVWND